MGTAPGVAAPVCILSLPSGGGGAGVAPAAALSAASDVAAAAASLLTLHALNSRELQGQRDNDITRAATSCWFGRRLATVTWF